MMNRRQLLKMITAATGTALVGGNAVLAGCARDSKGVATRFDETDVALLDEVAETIIPRTDTPGAKDAGVGQFMTVMVNDCYTQDEQKLFHSGLPKIDAASRDAYGKDFLSLSASQRHELVSSLDEEAKEQVQNGGEPHYFTLMKQLTLFGFFTSETAAMKVFRYVPVPGRYDGCLPYEEGDPAWATA